MAYSDFTSIYKVQTAFNLLLDEGDTVFKEIAPIEPSDHLKTTLKENLPLANAINTEKARSELVIAPVLLEVRRLLDFQIGFFSGTEFNVDRGTGLNGYCDYILTASKEIYEIRTPVVTLVEAKNENIKGGLGQCIAEMVAAQRFNQQQDQDIDAIYGAVTTGTNWKFLKLVNQLVFIDLDDYYIKEIDLILGILAHPFQQYL
ncbi:MULTISPECIES: hypothetical protein [unclassified Moorena]|uniref:hypothetical protein n=1 Tax=unclassified Moorena TaxID=2683338 RepID=UPI0013C8A34F|nr:MULTISPECIES: hypothetical protein [unclassified Moorena]NEO22887.1 hypothetical protein [Moorena sp. SIO4A5]NEQ60921.1 hypothetical protein [Moorena sp. SIO4A1]